MDHKVILKSAVDILGERGQDYGGIEDNFARISKITAAVLNKEISPYEIAMILHCVKLARMSGSQGKIDNYVDGINYLAFAGQFATNESNKGDSNDQF
jgi:hypothetical protein